MRAIRLHGEKARGRVALVDDEDYGAVSRYRWTVYERVRPRGGIDGPYARAYLPGSHGRTIFMHKLITGYQRTDHADRDGLNNQRQNLRPASHAENSRNQRPNAGSKSKYKGVTWHRANSVWQAEIMAGGKRSYLGCFASEEEAAAAYDTAARGAFGDFAYLNFGTDS